MFAAHSVTQLAAQTDSHSAKGSCWARLCGEGHIVCFSRRECYLVNPPLVSCGMNVCFYSKVPGSLKVHTPTLVRVDMQSYPSKHLV
jgi:hypothetical protein